MAHYKVTVEIAGLTPVVIAEFDDEFDPDLTTARRLFYRYEQIKEAGAVVKIAVDGLEFFVSSHPAH